MKIPHENDSKMLSNFSKFSKSSFFGLICSVEIILSSQPLSIRKSSNLDTSFFHQDPISRFRMLFPRNFSQSDKDLNFWFCKYLNYDIALSSSPSFYGLPLYFCRLFSMQWAHENMKWPENSIWCNDKQFPLSSLWFSFLPHLPKNMPYHCFIKRSSCSFDRERERE